MPTETPTVVELTIQHSYMTMLLNTLRSEVFDSPDEIMLVLYGQERYLSRQLRERQETNQLQEPEDAVA